MAVHIIEDDLAVSEALVVLLEQHGKDVVAYPDAESLLAAPPPESGDLVIVDLNLPGMSGVDAIQWLNGLEASPRIVVISGQSMNAIREQLRDVHAPIVVRKPLTEDKIAVWL